MTDTPYGTGASPAPQRAAFITATLERELRGQILDEYLADYARRNGPVSISQQNEARIVLDRAYEGTAEQPPQAKP